MKVEDIEYLKVSLRAIELSTSEDLRLFSKNHLPTMM